LLQIWGKVWKVLAFKVPVEVFNALKSLEDYYRYESVRKNSGENVMLTKKMQGPHSQNFSGKS